jgi:UDP-glucose 4-epimerase
MTEFKLGQKVLISGGAGPLGQALCKLLKEKNYVPITLDNLSTGLAEAVQFGPLLKRDLLETGPIQQFLKKESIKIIFHCAGWNDVENANIQPEKTYTQNLTGSMSLLRAALDSEVELFIYANTDQVGHVYADSKQSFASILADVIQAGLIRGSSVAITHETSSAVAAEALYLAAIR